MFEARNSRWRTGMLALASLGFVLGGLWFIGVFGPDHPEGVEATIIGWASIVFFGPCAIVLLRRSFYSGSVMRIDQNGIWWKNWSHATIPWSAVADVHTLTIQRQKMLGIELVDSAPYPAEGLMGRLAGANRAMTGVDAIWLTVTGTDRRFAELEAAVHSYVAAR